MKIRKKKNTMADVHENVANIKFIPPEAPDQIVKNRESPAKVGVECPKIIKTANIRFRVEDLKRST